ncbi:hypothetical protein D3C85_1211890 [compost metagenome]
MRILQALFKEVRQLHGSCNHSCVIARQAVFSAVSRFTCIRQLWNRSLNTCFPLVIDVEANQVRIWEIAIIVRIFFAAHRECFALRLIPAACFLNHFFTASENFCLAVFFILKSTLHTPEGVHVLEFGTRTEFLLSKRANGNVSVATHGAFFHFHIGHIAIDHNRSDFLKIGTSLFW